MAWTDVAPCPREVIKNPSGQRRSDFSLLRERACAFAHPTLARNDDRTRDYLRRITTASSQEMPRYISEETIARMVIPVITMFILKICAPYWIR